MKLACPLLALLIAAPATAQSAPAPAPATGPAPPTPAPAPAPVAPPAPAPPAPTPFADDEAPHPLGLALLSTSAFGVTHAGFFNQLLGARLDYRFGPHFAFGAALSYANLKGKDRRVHAALPEATLAFVAPLSGRAVALPLRASLGFLTQNGPTLRVSAGLAIAFSERVSLELLPLEPMVWVTRERPEVSLDASFALCFRP